MKLALTLISVTGTLLCLNRECTSYNGTFPCRSEQRVQRSKQQREHDLGCFTKQNKKYKKYDVVIDRLLRGRSR